MLTSKQVQPSILSGKAGIELAVFQNIVSAQFVLLPPFTATFNASSNVLLTNANNQVSVNWGFGTGLSLLDGVIAGGLGVLYYDPSGFVKPGSSPGGSFFYVNWQPISSVRAIFAGTK